MLEKAKISQQKGRTYTFFFFLLIELNYYFSNATLA